MLAGTALRLEVTIEAQAGTGSLPRGPHWTVRALLSNAAALENVFPEAARSGRHRKHPSPQEASAASGLQPFLLAVVRIGSSPRHRG